MKTLMRKKAMEYVVDQTVGMSDSRTASARYNKLYHVYKDVASVDTFLRETRKVVSCILLDDGRWGICCKGGAGVIFIPLETLGPRHSRCGLIYFLWQRQLDAAEELLHQHSIVNYALLLPLLQYQLHAADPAFETHCYSLISSDHQTLNEVRELKYV